MTLSKVAGCSDADEEKTLQECVQELTLFCILLQLLTAFSLLPPGASEHSECRRQVTLLNRSPAADQPHIVTPLL